MRAEWQVFAELNCNLLTHERYVVLKGREQQRKELVVSLQLWR